MSETMEKVAGPAEVVARYVAAYNNHDLAEMTAIHHEDVVFMDGGEERVRGIEKIKELVFENQFSKGGRIEVHSRMFNGKWVIDLQTMYNTARGDITIGVGYRVTDGRIDLAVYLDPE